MRVAFIGNCQASLIQSWVKAQASNVEVIDVPTVWNILAEDKTRLLDAFASCDAVFTQRLVGAISHEWLRTAELRRTLGENVVCWPNIYFDGYFPGIGYRYDATGKKLLGPLDEYHFSFIYTAFAQGRSSASVVHVMNGEEILGLFPDSVANSLQQLAQREDDTDIIISDFILLNYRSMRTMYSMNHPTNQTLLEMIRRLFGFVGEASRIGNVGDHTFPLDKIVLPSFPAIARFHGLRFENNPDRFKGNDFTISPHRVEVVPVARIYTAQSLVDAFFRCYEAEQRSPAGAADTPSPTLQRPG